MRRQKQKLDSKIYRREEFVKGRVFQRWKWILTTEDWHPNFADDTVKVSIIHMGRFNQKTKQIDFTGWRVCVWGADDTGMEIDVATEQEAEMLFERVVNFTTRHELSSWGFGPA